ncbi:ATP-binding protein [Halpernia sp. GG3]
MDSNNFKIINVSSTSISIEILDPSQFHEQFNLGSYIKIPYKNNDSKYVVGIIDNYKIRDQDNGAENTEPVDPSFILEVKLTGTLDLSNGGSVFERGGHGIPLPPNNGISLLNTDELKSIFTTRISENEKFTFSKLTTTNLSIPINGNKFFNKHFAIVGSTGSGKSHTVAKVLQEAISAKSTGFAGLNNSHIVIFDIHGEYEQAFPSAQILDASNLSLPYWMLNGDELEQMFLDTGDRNNYNQSSILRKIITENKIKYNEKIEKVHFDSPIKFDIKEVFNCLSNFQNETINAKANDKVMIREHAGNYTGSNSITDSDGLPLDSKGRIEKYFSEIYDFIPNRGSNVNKGVYADGTLDKFIERLENKINNSRLPVSFWRKLKRY